MILRENPQAAKAILEDALSRLNSRERTAGIHVSDLVTCLRRSWYRRRGILPAESDSSEFESILALGQGHHGVLQPPQNSEVAFLFITPSGEQVHGHIDVYWPASPLWGQPTEIKSTRYSSSKNAAVDTPHYIEQLASYVLGMGQTKGRLLIWHMMGDYKENRAPVLKCFDIEFTKQEIDDWRQELHDRVELLISPEPPEIENENHYTWECKNCPFHIKVGGPCEGAKGREAPFFFQSNSPVKVV